MAQRDTENCPICGRQLTEPPSRRGSGTADVAYYSCPHCGEYGLTRQAWHIVASRLDVSANPKPDRAAAFAYMLRRMQMGQEWPLVDSNTAKQIIETAKLPSVAEQA